MNWFLLLIILLMAGGGYYGYQTLHGQVTVDELQISDLKTKLQDATDGEQKSADNVTHLTGDLTAAQAKVSDLEKQLQAAKAAQPDAQQPQVQAVSITGGTTSSNSTGGTVFTTKLGTITSLDGKTYTACQILKINPDNIVISDADGVTQLALNVLPAPVQKMLGYDAKQGLLSNDQVAALDQQLQAATAAGR